jgi:CDP-diglyceride synthetase
LRKPLSITSPDHAWALAIYLMLAGAITIIGNNTTSAIYRAAGENVADVWGTLVMVFAGSALISAITARRSRTPETNMLLEMWACWGLSANLFFFCWKIWERFGEAAQSSLTFGGIFAVGALLRALQIIHERMIIKKARAFPVKSDPVLADPREDNS